ncbi:MAG: hypothetical protein NC926_10405 [Candidatus Omnitrophica bacterium]|nr:hypothetical protein [Candidatus Omnitrophota bacterium]
MKDIDNIIIKKQFRHVHIKNIDEIKGFDTETIDGKCVLIADSDCDYVIVNSIDDILKFLLKKKNTKTLNFFYNINFDFNAIIKHLPKDKIKELYIANEVEYNGYKIEFIPGKYFSVSKNKMKVRFYDLYNFINLSLNTACKLYLGKEKIGEAKEFEKYWKKDKDFAIKYCIHDCVLTKELGEKIFKEFKKLDIYYHKPYSFGKLSEVYFIKKCKVPTINRLSSDILKSFLKCYKGNWIEQIKIGYFKNIYEYDINSAYPYALTHIINWNKGFWTKNIKNLDECYYAYFDVVVDIDDFIPVITLKWKYFNINPIGKFNCQITKWEYEMVKDKIIFIDKFIGFVPYKYDYFLKNEILNLYQKRKEHEYLKTIMNSLYGKFMQMNEDIYTGNLWNPVVSSFITTMLRYIIKNSIKGYEDYIISINTDCFYSEKEIKNIPVSDKIGEFKMKKWDEGIFINNGIYHLRNSNGEEKIRIRGFETNLNLFELLEKNKDKSIIEIPEKCLVSYKMALVQHTKYSINDINKIVNIVKKIDLNNFNKRMLFTKNKIKCGDILEKNYITFPRYYDEL